MDIKKLLKDFPIFSATKSPLIYFDNAATSQKPQAVIDALVHFYTHANANISRGVYPLAEDATRLYQQARQKVARFIGAQTDELIFTKGTTESINFVAATWGRQFINAGDEIVITELEHHSNMIPWQQLAQEKRAILKYIPVNDDGSLNIENLSSIITKKTKLVACAHVSNAVGTHLPVEEIIAAAHAVGARVLIDAAQSIAHQRIDVKKLGVDFLAFGGHKMLGPTGIGGLYITNDLLHEMHPYQFGGGMIHEATYQTACFLQAPEKFEAGTPPIAQAIGLGAAVDYLFSKVDFAALQAHEAMLCKALISELKKISAIRLLGLLEQLEQKGHMVSFTVRGYHAHDVAAYLAQSGICVRAGSHCAQPLAQRLNIDASVRASFYLYNSLQEVELLVEALKKLVA